MFRTLDQVKWDDIEVGEVYAEKFRGKYSISVKTKECLGSDGATSLASEHYNETEDVSGEKICGYLECVGFYRLPKSVQRLFYVPEVEA